MSSAPPLDWWDLPWEQVRDRLIRAMCPEKVCRTCGQPSRRIVEKTPDYAEFRKAAVTMRKDPGMEGAGKGQGGLAGSGYNRDPYGVALGSPTAIHRSGERYVTLGFTDCGHNDWRPGVVLELTDTAVLRAVLRAGKGSE